MHTVSEKIGNMCSNKRDKMITGGKSNENMGDICSWKVEGEKKT